MDACPEGRTKSINQHPLLPAQLVTVARLHPWYEALLEERGIRLPAADADKAAQPELTRLPLMTAELLERHYYADAPPGDEVYSRYQTSGTSTGRRKTIYYCEEDDRHYMQAKTTSFREWLGVPGPGWRALADLGTGHAANTALAIFDKLGMEGAAIAFTLPVEEHIAKLRSFRPHLLYTMPSIIEAIADASPDCARFGVAKIILVGEMAPPEWRSRIAARFGLTGQDVLDTYGSIEIGAIAAYSPRLGKYVLADGLLGECLPAERIDSSFAPLGSGEGVLVLTSYVRKLFPAIRYVTYDVVRDFETIADNGIVRQTFSSIVKRIGPELKHGEKISLYDIEAAVSRHLPDATLRAAVRNNRLTLYIKSDLLSSEAIAVVQEEVAQRIPDINAMIRNRLLKGVEIIPVRDRSELPRGAVKAKKLY